MGPFLRWSSVTVGDAPDLNDDALLVFETPAERLLAAGDAEAGLSADGARRLRQIGEELSVHALALRVLVSSGVSPARLRPHDERATALCSAI
jgi:hypothetical protein